MSPFTHAGVGLVVVGARVKHRRLGFPMAASTEYTLRWCKRCKTLTLTA